jgi:hypothetical protein
MASKTKAAVEEKTVKRGSGDVVSEGVYRKMDLGGNAGSVWVLNRWRLIVDGDAGSWHKVHGNRKRSVGSFRLILED